MRGSHLGLGLLLVLARIVQAGTPESWVVTTDLWGNPYQQTLELERSGGLLTGTLDGARLNGRIDAGRLHFLVTEAERSPVDFNGIRTADTIRGTAESADTNSAGVRVRHAFVARKIPQRPGGPPRHHDFTPVDYSNTFAADRAPVLTIWPGDSVKTRTVDSGGVDATGETRALFGNPQTGPFFVGTAVAGDMLVIHIRRLRLSRDTADSLDSIVARAIPQRLVAQALELGKPVRWQLDLQRGTASPQSPSERMKDFAVPLRPMLGGLGVAPGFGYPPISTGDSGRFGGNMDFNEIAEGSIVYLPVFQPGALLYLGDAHALQGDGETSQYALETAMEVEFVVDVRHGAAPSTPRIETSTQIIALGQAGSLDDALRVATGGLIEWLQQDYALDLSECAQVLGSSVHYVVANLAGRNVGIAAKLDKSRLSGLRMAGKDRSGNPPS